MTERVSDESLHSLIHDYCKEEYPNEDAYNALIELQQARERIAELESTRITAYPAVEVLLNDREEKLKIAVEALEKITNEHFRGLATLDMRMQSCAKEALEKIEAVK